MKISFYSLLIYFLPMIGLCQGTNIDSLKNILRKSEGRESVTAYLELCWEYRFSNADTARKYGFKALELAKKESFSDLEAEALNHIGVTYEAQGNYNEALSFELEALNIRRRLNDPAKTANTLNTLGIVYDEKGDYEKAISHYYESIKIYESVSDESKIAMVLTNIGIVMRAQKVYQNAARNYLKAMKIYIKLGNKFGVAACHSNLGRLHLSLNQYDSAIHYSLLAATEFEEQNIKQFLPTAYSNAAAAFDKKGEFQKAKTYFLEAKELHQSYDNKKELSYTLSQLARLEARLGNNRQANEYGQEALSLANKIQALEQKMQAHEALAEVSAASSNYKSAYNSHLQFVIIKDSLFEIEKSREIVKLQTQFETEKKDSQIKLLNRDNELKTATIAKNYWVIGALATAMMALLIIFFAWRKIQRQKQLVVMQEQKVRLREIQMKSVIESQEQERRRFASDLHDGMGQLVSALQLNIQSIKGSRDIEKSAMLVEGSEQLLRDIQMEIRNIAFNLMPPVLMKEGLIAAIRELTRKLNSSAGIKAGMTVFDCPDRFEGVVEISVYRIVQELLSNIIKHNQASSIEISLTGFENEVVLTLEDDGMGFDLERFKNSSQSNGWRNIQTRIGLIRGTIEWDTQVGRKNNTVTIHLPVIAQPAPVNTVASQNT